MLDMFCHHLDVEGRMGRVKLVEVYFIRVIYLLAVVLLSCSQCFTEQAKQCLNVVTTLAVILKQYEGNLKH